MKEKFLSALSAGFKGVFYVAKTIFPYILSALKWTLGGVVVLCQKALGALERFGDKR